VPSHLPVRKVLSIKAIVLALELTREGLCISAMAFEPCLDKVVLGLIPVKTIHPSELAHDHLVRSLTPDLDLWNIGSIPRLRQNLLNLLAIVIANEQHFLPVAVFYIIQLVYIDRSSSRAGLVGRDNHLWRLG
jgi:hypothetical protein